jgi:hypothetical protein
VPHPLLQGADVALPSPCAIRHRLTRSCDISEL